MGLKEYLSSRRADIEGQIKALEAELAEIRVAQRAIGADFVQNSAPESPRLVTARSFIFKRRREGTIMDWILKALAAVGPDGAETDDVISAVEMIGGPSVPRNSITPQLSRLKSGGMVIQEGRRWKLPPNEKAPQPEGQEAFL